MNEPKSENTSQISIDRVEMGTGWVCFEGGENPPAPEQLPLYLHDALENWLRNNAEFKIRTVLPIVVNGNTVAINVWFD